MSSIVVDHTWVVVSSSLFFIPGTIALFRQNIIVALVLLTSALFSMLYHVNNELAYSELDVIWASLAVLVSFILLAVLLTQYPPWNWRVLLPLAFGFAGLIVYFLEGQSTATITDEHYEIYHSVWHLCIALAGISLVYTPVSLTDANFTFYEMVVKTAQQARKNSAKISVQQEDQEGYSAVMKAAQKKEALDRLVAQIHEEKHLAAIIEQWRTDKNSQARQVRDAENTIFYDQACVPHTKALD